MVYLDVPPLGAGRRSYRIITMGLRVSPDCQWQSKMTFRHASKSYGVRELSTEST